MFIGPDEYLIIMDVNVETGDYSLTADELKMLADVGVRTVYFHAAMRWDQMQTEPAGEIDWSWPDERVRWAREAGLKALLPCLFTFPAWLPDNYFHSRKAPGQLYDVPHYESAEMALVVDYFLELVLERYAADDVQVVYSIPGNGEFAFNGHPRLEAEVDKVADWVVDRQRLLEPQHHEIWTAFHPIHQPRYWSPIYGALFSAYPHARHYGIIFTYVQHQQSHFREMLRRNQASGMVYYGGTEYVQGMKSNMPKLLRDEVRMLTAPIHPYQGHTRLKPWMLREIEYNLEHYAKGVKA